MPVFEFTCKGCGHVFPILVRWGTSDTVICENCGGNDLGRIRVQIDAADGEGILPRHPKIAGEAA